MTDDHRGHGVAGEIGDRAGLGHEPVDPDDQADPGDQVGAVALQPSPQDGQPGAGHSGGALGRDDHEHEQARSAHRRERDAKASPMNSDAIVRYIAVPSRLNEYRSGRRPRRCCAPPRGAPSSRSTAATRFPTRRSRRSVGTPAAGSTALEIETPVAAWSSAPRTPKTNTTQVV